MFFPKRKEEESNICQNKTCLQYFYILADIWHHIFLIGGKLRSQQLFSYQGENISLHVVKRFKPKIRRKIVPKIKYQKGTFGIHAILLSSFIISSCDFKYMGRLKLNSSTFETMSLNSLNALMEDNSWFVCSIIRLIAQRSVYSNWLKGPPLIASPLNFANFRDEGPLRCCWYTCCFLFLPFLPGCFRFPCLSWQSSPPHFLWHLQHSVHFLPADKQEHRIFDL